MAKEKTSFRIKLQRMVAEEFAMLKEAYDESVKPRFSYHLSFGVDRADQVIGCFLNLDFTSNDRTFIKLAFACHYHIHPESWEELSSIPGPMVLQPKMMILLGQTTFGAARGYLQAKTENTPFNSFMIPMVMIEKNITEPLQIEEG